MTAIENQTLRPPEANVGDVSETTKRREFLEYARDHTKSEYDELIDAWKQIDTKAQGATAIAGIFLAAAFAYARAPTTPLVAVEKWGLGLVVCCLVAAIGFAAWAMFVRPTFALTARKVCGMVAEAIQAQDASSELTRRYEGILADTINALGPVNRSLLNHVNVKAGRLRLAHIAILAAATGIVLLTIRALAFAT